MKVRSPRGLKIHSRDTEGVSNIIGDGKIQVGLDRLLQEPGDIPGLRECCVAVSGVW